MDISVDFWSGPSILWQFFSFWHWNVLLSIFKEKKNPIHLKTTVFTSCSYSYSFYIVSSSVYKLIFVLVVLFNLISNTSFHVLAKIWRAWLESCIPARIPSVNLTELVWIIPQLLDNWVHSQVLVIMNILNSPAINIFMQVLPPPPFGSFP